jgi:hypothetical protein
MAGDFKNLDCHKDWMDEHGGRFLDGIIAPIYKALKKVDVFSHSMEMCI